MCTIIMLCYYASVEMFQRKHIRVDDFPEHLAMMWSMKNEQFEADYESMVVNMPFSQHTAKLHVNAPKNRYKNIVPCKSIVHVLYCNTFG